MRMPTSSLLQRLSPSSQSLLAQGVGGNQQQVPSVLSTDSANTTTPALATQQVQTQPPIPPDQTVESGDLSEAEKMALLDEAISEAEQFAPPTEPVSADMQQQNQALEAVHTALMPVAQSSAPPASTDSSANPATAQMPVDQSASVQAPSDAQLVTTTQDPLADVSPSDSPSMEDVALLTQALPQAANQAFVDAQQQVAVGASSVGKERTASGWNLDGAVQEVGGGMAVVEQEKSPEIAPEVENYLERVENHQTSPAQTIEDMAPAVSVPPPAGSKQTVRVLPVTKAQDDAGMKKSPKYGLRWLVEWSHKIIKMFNGKAVYRPAESKG